MIQKQLLLFLLLCSSFVLQAQCDCCEPKYAKALNNFNICDYDAAWQWINYIYQSNEYCNDCARCYDITALRNKISTCKNNLNAEGCPCKAEKLPSNPINKDSLLISYYNLQQYTEAVKLGQELYQYRTKDTTILAILAHSEYALGEYNNALRYYKELYAIDLNLFTLYQIAVIEFQLEDYDECILYLNQITRNIDSEKQKIHIVYSRDSEGQDVPLIAATYNVIGVTYLKKEDKKRAKEYFNKALKVFPSFKLAQYNLETLK